MLKEKVELNCGAKTVLMFLRKLRLLSIAMREIKRNLVRCVRLDQAQQLGIVRMGVGTYGNPNIHFWDRNSVLTVGNYCSIAEGVTFVLGGGHNLEYVSTFPFTVQYSECKPTDEIIHPTTKGDIEIGSDVWIGTNALILSGVKIGNGAVVGAGSVVVTNVPDYAIVIGNPARLLRYRFTDSEILALQELEWWNWSKDRVLSKYQMLMAKPNLKTLFTEMG